MGALIQYTLQGLAAGGFYALAALGLAVIFGVLGVVNFSHGACYMLGAVGTALLLNELGMGFWAALVVIPVVDVRLRGAHRAGASCAGWSGSTRCTTSCSPSGSPWCSSTSSSAVTASAGCRTSHRPRWPAGSTSAGLSLSTYQVFAAAFSLLVCVLVWLVITRTRVGMIVRAATEDADRTRALGINVGRWVTPVFGFGIALAGLAGVLAAPFRAVTADMGSNFIIILFAVVVIGGLGSIMGAVVAGFLVGLVEAYGQAYVPALAAGAHLRPDGRGDPRAAGGTLRTGGGRMSDRRADTCPAPSTSRRSRCASPSARSCAPLMLLRRPRGRRRAAVAGSTRRWRWTSSRGGCSRSRSTCSSGYTGLLSFGHAAFWGASAYATGLVAIHSGLPFPLAILAGAVVAMLLAVPTGYLAVRRTGIYFAMVTLAFAQMLYFIANQWRDVTGGEDGLQGIPKSFFGMTGVETDPFYFYYAAAPIVLIGVAIAWRVVHSPFGRVLVAVRDNPARARALGYDVDRYKVMAFVISAGVAGLAGGVFAVSHGFASLQELNWTTSGKVVLITVLGGIGTFWGGPIGAAVVVLLEDRLASSGFNGRRHHHRHDLHRHRAAVPPRDLGHRPRPDREGSRAPAPLTPVGREGARHP